jgi:DNA-binding YbaB/EbfC family protein
MLGSLGNLAALVKQAQQIGGRLDDLNQQLKSRRATGSSGGGLVEIEVNAVGEMLACKIDPTLIAEGDQEMLEDLIRGAANQALAKGRELHAEAMRTLAGGLQLPGMDEALKKLMSG